MDAEQREISVQLEYAALIGELARPMVHEVNNFLNTILLQVALLETAAPDAIRTDLALLRKESKNVAQIIQDWHRWNRPQPLKPQLLDINEIVRDVFKNPTIEALASADVVLDL